MTRAVHKLVLFAVVLAVALPLAAAEKGKKGGKKGGGPGSEIQQLAEKVKNLPDLSAEQKEKLDALVKEFTKKVAEAREKLGPGLMKQITAAEKKARDEGKKGKEAQQAVAAAVNLSAEQKEALAKVRSLTGEFRKAVVGLLTPAQVEKSGIKAGKKKNR